MKLKITLFVVLLHRNDRSFTNDDIDIYGWSRIIKIMTTRSQHTTLLRYVIIPSTNITNSVGRLMAESLNCTMYCILCNGVLQKPGSQGLPDDLQLHKLLICNSRIPRSCLCILIVFLKQCKEITNGECIIKIRNTKPWHILLLV